jgi:uncharacterized repeat protein (TIGR03943 family)
MRASSILSSIRDVVLLSGWGLFILWTWESGRLSSYLHPSLQPWCLASGILLFTVALLLLSSLFSSEKSCHDHHGECCSHDHGDHEHVEHSHRKTASLPLILKTLLILAPMAISITGKTSGYSLSTVQNRGVVEDLTALPSARPAAKKSSSVTLPSTTPASRTKDLSSEPEPPSAAKPASSGPMPIQVIDMLYAIQMPSYREEFDGKEVELTAQYVPMTTANPKGDRFQAIRMFITCCAADAKPVGVTVKCSNQPSVPEMGWLKITGRPTFPMEGGRRTAVIEATKVEECPAPAEPFVY